MTVHFFGWPDTSWLQSVSESRSVLAMLPHPSGLPLLSQPASSRVTPDHSSPMLRQTTQNPQGCRWPGKPPLGYFWPLCWPVDSPPKAITEFSSCFADGLEYVKNVPLGDPRAPQGVGSGGLGAQLWPGPLGADPWGSVEEGWGQMRTIDSHHCWCFRAQSMCKHWDSLPSVLATQWGHSPHFTEKEAAVQGCSAACQRPTPGKWLSGACAQVPFAVCGSSPCHLRRIPPVPWWAGLEEQAGAGPEVSPYHWGALRVTGEQTRSGLLLLHVCAVVPWDLPPGPQPGTTALARRRMLDRSPESANEDSPRGLVLIDAHAGHAGPCLLGPDDPPLTSIALGASRGHRQRAVERRSACGWGHCHRS